MLQNCPPNERLNLGSGPNHPRPGWLNLDRDLLTHDPEIGLYRTDFVENGLPFADQSLQLVVAHHVFQMVPYIRLRDTFKEVYRVLKPAGRLRISVPDPLGAFQALENGQKSHFPIVDEAETSLDGKFCAYLLWYSEARTVFTRKWLVELLAEAGFSGFQLGCTPKSPLPCRFEGENDLDTRLDESIYLVALRSGAIA